MKKLESFLKNELGIKPKETLAKMLKFEEKIFEWNEKVNLVSRKLDTIEDQILNSIFFLTKYGLLGNEKILDLGTGGGFPGIPLKILYPNLILVLNDSIRKKINATEEIAASLGLKYVECASGRAEELVKQKKFSKKFDLVVSKAVTNITSLYEWGHEFLNANGHMICIKGGNLKAEVTEFQETFPKKELSIIEYDFAYDYGVEDKKLIIIK